VGVAEFPRHRLAAGGFHYYDSASLEAVCVCSMLALFARYCDVEYCVQYWGQTRNSLR
jgi:hypothetical protein